jgi:NADH dehydrogenase
MFAITGATGFVGRNLIKSLVDDGAKVTALIRSPNKAALFNGFDITLKNGDLLHKESLKRFLDGNIYVIHLASVVSSTKRQDYQRVNIDGMINIVEASEDSGIKKFIYISSINAEENPDSLYGSTKKEAEKILEQSKLAYTILRPSVIYGKYDNKNIATMIKMAQRFPIFPMLGDGNCKRQPLFVNDLIWVIKELFKNNTGVFKKYNVGGSEILTLNEIANIIFKVIGKRRMMVHIPIAAANRLARSLVFIKPEFSSNLEQLKHLSKDIFFDCNLLKADFSFNPIDFENGLRFLLLH